VKNEPIHVDGCLGQQLTAEQNECYAASDGDENPKWFATKLTCSHPEKMMIRYRETILPEREILLYKGGCLSYDRIQFLGVQLGQLWDRVLPIFYPALFIYTPWGSCGSSLGSSSHRYFSWSGRKQDPGPRTPALPQGLEATGEEFLRNGLAQDLISFPADQ
jgi:hypothetical protein